MVADFYHHFSNILVSLNMCGWIY